MHIYTQNFYFHYLVIDLSCNNLIKTKNNNSFFILLAISQFFCSPLLRSFKKIKENPFTTYFNIYIYKIKNKKYN